MALLYAAGQYANLLERALSVTLSPAVDALFPATNLYDGRPSRACRHGSNAANPTITADLSAFTPASGAATYYVTARAGERRRLNSSSTTSITLQNLSTGFYLQPGGTWSSGVGNLTASVDYQVESYTLCQAATVILKIVVTTGTTVGDWPACNAIVVWGHNLDPGMGVAMRTSTDNFGGSNVLEATGAVRQPSFMMLGNTSYNRYVRLALTGTNQATPWYAEVMPCHLETAVTTLGVDHEITYEEAQIRSGGLYGESYVYPLASWPRRLCKWRFNMDSAREREIREEVVLRSRGGAYPLLLVPTSTDATPPVLFGRLDAKWSTTRTFADVWSTDLTMSEGFAPTPLA